MRSGAVLSDDGVYRYRLWRHWGDGMLMAWIMLNPSTADASIDDHTIRRCRFYAERGGYDGIEVVNLFALRSTDPKVLRDHPDPTGPDNWQHWVEVLQDHRVGMIVAAWGASRPSMPGSPRGVPVPSFCYDNRPAGSMWCLGTTAAGHPRHPSRLSNIEPLVRFER